MDNKRNIKDVVSKMTLEEKAGLCSGADFWHLKGVERLGIPSIMVSDGPHGLRKQDKSADHLGINDSIQAVCFPAACATAASFDRELLYKLGDALGEECQAEDVSVLLGPAVNIKRSPLCGRNFEYFSEDPYLTGELAASEIEGVQGWNVGTSIKHFAANNQEYYRLTSSSEMDERTLREIYLSGFERAIKKAKPWTVMCSYNKLNGVYASENKKLLTDILREEWGFDGAVVSDWGAVNKRVDGLKAGLDLEMPSCNGITDAQIVKAVESGDLEMEVLDKTVERILEVIFSYSENRISAIFDRNKHHLLAKELARECGVLLKNDGALPLDKSKKVAFIGEFAIKPRFQGGGSSHINASKVISSYEAAKLLGADVVYSKGFPADKDEVNELSFKEAIDVAKNSEVAVVFAGLPDSFESEGYDRKDMKLPLCQNELINKILEVQKNTVVVLYNGSSIELPWADDVNGVLEMYLAGEATGEATVDLLYGEANPCGRLPESFPYKLEDNPSYLFFHGDGKKVEYKEGVYVGYRYYDKKKMGVRYPFGYGLSYTTFEYSNLRIDKTDMEDKDIITVKVDITNTGKLAGKEVVQLYVKDNTGTIGRPEKELKGFDKIALSPGEVGTVEFKISKESLVYYNTEINDWYAASGNYEILICRSYKEIELRESINFRTTKKIPFVIDENTTVGELLNDPRTKQVVEGQIQQFLSSGGNSDIAKAAISDEMIMHTMIYSPLRSLRTFANLDDNAINAMIAYLNFLTQ